MEDKTTLGKIWAFLKLGALALIGSATLGLIVASLIYSFLLGWGVIF